MIADPAPAGTLDYALYNGSSGTFLPVKEG
jgi:hypothetical protein